MTEDGGFAVENALTTIDLIALPVGDRSAIKGNVVALASHADAPIGGLLVVASGADGAVSGLSDKSGSFEIFNVPAGSQTLEAGNGCRTRRSPASESGGPRGLVWSSLEPLDCWTQSRHEAGPC